MGFRDERSTRNLATLFVQLQDILVYLLINGSLYVLISLGLTLSYGIQGTLDMANPAFMVLGAYLGLQLMRWGVNPLLALPLVVPVLFLLGIFNYRTIIMPLRGRPHMDPALALLGLLFVIETGINQVWTGELQRIKLWFFSLNVDLLDQRVEVNRLIVPLAFAVTYGIVALVHQASPFGRLVRATYSNREAAELSGINTGRIDYVVYGASVAVAGIAGMVGAIAFPFSAATIFPWFLIAFAVVLTGGRASLVGPLLAGFLIALAEALTAKYISFNWIAVVSALATVGVLLLRPRGLLGRASTVATP